MNKSHATGTDFDFWLDRHVRTIRASCIILKIDNLNWTQNNDCMLSKGIFC
jgi:hypothetical protein